MNNNDGVRIKSDDYENNKQMRNTVELTSSCITIIHFHRASIY